MFLDDTACNLASANLITFYDTSTKQFDVAGYEHLCRLWTVVLEISVMMAQFPSKAIAELSYEFRTLGLGFANIGGLLMTMGLSYDSKEGRALCGALSAIMTGTSYATSAEMAKELGPFPGYKKNAGHMLRVIRNHRRAAHGEIRGYEGIAVNPVPLDYASVPQTEIVERAKFAWDQALELGELHGYRNAQTTVVAPTGTIGLVMDCDTTGIEPDFALVKFKKLAGGGYWKIINRAVPEALRALGYRESDIAEIEAYAVGHGSLSNAPAINVSTLKAKGFTDEALAKVEAALPTAFDIKFAFNKWTFGEEFLRNTLNIAPEAIAAPGFDLLAAVGFSKREIEAANVHICGAMTVEGAPHLKAEHYSVFDCANPCGKIGKRYLVGGKPHPHDGGVAAVHLGRDLQDHQHAERRHGGGLQVRLSAVLETRAEGQRALPRRLEAVAAAELAADQRRRRGRRCGRELHGEADGRAHRAALGKGRGAAGRAHRRHARTREDAGPPQGLHPEGRGRRPQGLSAHRRI